MQPVPPARLLLFVVSEDWYFLSHRLPMAEAAQNAGWQVHVAARMSTGADEIARRGFTVHPFDWRRANVSPFKVIGEVLRLRALYKRLRPDLIHHVAMKPILVGSLAAVGFGCAVVDSFAGLGFLFLSKRPIVRLARRPLQAALRLFLRRKGTRSVVQNEDDRALLEAIGVPAGKIDLISGSGVDPQRFLSTPEPPGDIRVTFVGRLLDDKGIRVVVAAHQLLRERVPGIRLAIAGQPDPENPTSIGANELARWHDIPGIEIQGQVGDVAALWANAHIAVLPSRREGLPLCLIEAASCGRPIVASDVPGCRAIALEGVNGLLVPPDDPAALADAIERLARDRDLRLRFGAAGRRLVEERFSSEAIGRAVVETYERACRDAKR